MSAAPVVPAVSLAAGERAAFSMLTLLMVQYPGRTSLALAEAAHAAGMPAQTVRNRLSSGTLGLRTHLVGRRRYVSLVDLAVWLDAAREAEPRPRPRGRPTKAVVVRSRVGGAV